MSMLAQQIQQLAAFTTRHAHRLLLCLLAVTIVGGTLYAARVGDTFRYVDERIYYTLASNVVQHHTFSLDGTAPTAIKPPGYSMFIAALVVFGAPIVVVRAANFVLLAGTMLLVYGLTARHTSRATGVFAAALTLAYPVLFYTASTLYPQTLGTFLLMLVLVLLVALDRRRARSVWCVVLGALLGALILVVPTFIFLLPVVVVWRWTARRARRWVEIGVVLLVCGCVVGAWSVRNTLALDRFIFVSSNAANNLIVSRVGEQDDATAEQTASVEAMQDGELARQSTRWQQVLAYVTNNPGDVVRRYVDNFFNYFNYRNELRTESESSALRDLIMLLTYGPLLLVYAVRVVCIKRFPPTRWEWLLIATYLANAAMSAVFFTRIRYRLPFDLLLIMLVAIFGHTLLQRWWARRTVAERQLAASDPV